jgi:hypothetical protein
MPATRARTVERILSGVSRRDVGGKKESHSKSTPNKRARTFQHGPSKEEYGQAVEGGIAHQE